MKSITSPSHHSSQTIILTYARSPCQDLLHSYRTRRTYSHQSMLSRFPHFYLHPQFPPCWETANEFWCPLTHAVLAPSLPQCRYSPRDQKLAHSTLRSSIPHPSRQHSAPFSVRGSILTSSSILSGSFAASIQPDSSQYGWQTLDSERKVARSPTYDSWPQCLTIWTDSRWLTVRVRRSAS
jgi:hypothetical protein